MKNIDSLDMKIADITSPKPSSSSGQPSKKPSSYYELPSADHIKFSLLNSPEKSSHASQFTKTLLPETLSMHSTPNSKMVGCH